MEKFTIWGGHGRAISVFLGSVITVKILELILIPCVFMIPSGIFWIKLQACLISAVFFLEIYLYLIYEKLVAVIADAPRFFGDAKLLRYGFALVFWQKTLLAASCTVTSAVVLFFAFFPYESGVLKLVAPVFAITLSIGHIAIIAAKYASIERLLKLCRRIMVVLDDSYERTIRKDLDRFWITVVFSLFSEALLLYCYLRCGSFEIAADEKIVMKQVTFGIASFCLGYGIFFFLRCVSVLKKTGRTARYEMEPQE